MAVDPTRFDEFVIESMIGEGGMGKVYRARQTALDRWVALKVLPRAKENPSFIERFQREARSAARLVHPNIIQIHTIGELQGVPYFTMEYVEGVDLEHIVHDREHLLTRDEIVEIARSVIKALGVAAEQGVVHRDIKPANIMVSKTGLVKVMDFGLAKEMDHNITQSGVVVGTPTYMSPEQGSGRTVDIRADFYSLGCVLYEIVKGSPPFTADKVAAVIYKHMYELPTPLNGPDTPVDQLLEEFIMKLLKKEPSDRYKSADEALECLSQIYCNHGAAELGLAKHAQRHFKLRKAKEAEKDLANDPDAPKMKVPQGPAFKPPASEIRPGPLPVDNGHVEEKTPLVSPAGPKPAAQEAASRPTEANPTPPVQDAPPPTPPAGTDQPSTGIRQTQRVKFLKVQRNRPNTPDPDYAPIHTPIQLKKLETGRNPPLPPAARKDDSQHNLKPVIPPKPLNMLKPPPRKEKSNPILEGGPGKRPPSVHVPKPSSILNDAEVITRETVAPVMRAVAKPEQMSTCFDKLPDGRWSYQKLAARCEKAEGIARVLPPVSVQPGVDRGLGDCLLCPNWNDKLGCALAYNEELVVKNRFSGLKLLSEQAAAWMGAERFDRAIALLNEFIEDNPNNPDGYRELARIYDRADYKGRDKRRGIIMYMRFIDLARTMGNYSQIEISRAEARAHLLKTGIVSSGNLAPGEAIEFDCFYRGSTDCYIYGRADPEKLVAVKIGIVDPHTGFSEPDPGASTSTFKRAVSMFSRSKSDQEKQEEQSAVRKELARLQDLDISYVLKEHGIICLLKYDSLSPLEERVMPPDLSILKLKEKSSSHSFIFTSRNAFEGQQLRELLVRRLARR